MTVIRYLNYKKIDGLGLLMSAARGENDRENFLDGKITKETYQKAQFLDVLIMLLSIAGTFLCHISVRITTNLIF